MTREGTILYHTMPYHTCTHACYSPQIPKFHRGSACGYASGVYCDVWCWRCRELRCCGLWLWLVAAWEREGMGWEGKSLGGWVGLRMYLFVKGSGMVWYGMNKWFKVCCVGVT